MSSSKRPSVEEAELDERIQYVDPDGQDPTRDQRPHNHHKTLPFHELFKKLFKKLFNPLHEIRKQNAARLTGRSRRGTKIASPAEQRAMIVKRFITYWRNEVGNDIYPVIRLILPDRDRERAMYGLKEKTIAKLIIKVLKVDPRSEDALSLLSWKLPGQIVVSRTAGDFAGRCFEVLSKRSMRSEVGDMRIAEVNQLLNQLSAVSKEAEQIQIFETFYQRMNAEEMMWLIRIVLRQMKIGVSEKTVLDLWHPDGEALFNVSSNLRRVCWELTDPAVRLESERRGVTIMAPFQPQLAQFQIHSFQKMVEKLGCSPEDKEFWIEEKLDGERMQLHMVEDHSVSGGFRFTFWSRKGTDYTYLYGHGFDDEKSSLTRFIRGAFRPNIRNIILDGEMITWDTETNKMVAFGSLKSAAISEQQNPIDGTGSRPLFRVFDCLYVNDHNITQYVLRERRKVVERALCNIDLRIEIHKCIAATEAITIEEELRKVIAESSEGLVLKNPRSAYRLNSRNDDWMKVKPEYMNEFGESLDCVIIGGYFGSGCRGGAHASFLCGLRVDQNHIDKSANPKKCYSFFRVGGGFTAADYATIRHHTNGKWIDWDQKRPPDDLIELAGGKRQFERPDQWIQLEDSLVLEVKAASVCPSDSFATGFTLRFPRFKRLRLDKSWEEALSLDDFLELRSRVEEESKEKEFTFDSRRKAPKRMKKEVAIVGNDRTVTTQYAGPQTMLFEGLKFCVLSEMLRPQKKSKVEVEQIIKLNGGTITQNSTATKDIICISDKHVVSVAALIKSGYADIVKPIWIFDALRQSEIDGTSRRSFLVPLEPRHLLHATEITLDSIKNTVDVHGDSFARDATVDELRQVVSDMVLERKDICSAREFLTQLEASEIGASQLSGWIFNGVVAWFASGDKSQDHIELLLAQNQFRFAGGCFATSEDQDNMTHLIIVDEKSNFVKYLRARLSLRPKPPHVVRFGWLLDCWKEKSLLDEAIYTPL
ncbi:DNA ligase 4 [Podosphaera aphanis]|nr:DNA ligase 4 [Podosphaera aphanis]